MHLSHLKEVFKTPESQFLNFKWHAEASEYDGCEFDLKGKKYFFRTAKVTPKKNGLFVTLWKRNKLGETIPFDRIDPFDFLAIECFEGSKRGLFLFTKKTLEMNKVLSDRDKKQEGKRGFRVYPTWTRPKSKQALLTQTWQVEHFSQEASFK